jgi:hypothetical protein
LISTLLLAGLLEGTADHPLFRVPFPTIFGACITTPALGAAQRMLDIFIENSAKASSLYTGARWAEEQATQVRIAEADAGGTLKGFSRTDQAPFFDGGCCCRQGLDRSVLRISDPRLDCLADQ